jgi:inorganic triphosphatase YgiF
MQAPKWKIKGLNGKSSFRKTAIIILRERINNLKRLISIFLINENIDSLHNVRISLRRVRYNMELFYGLFDRKKFLKLYNIIENLQDKTGTVRDIHVLKQNILLFGKDEEFIIPDKMNVRIEEKEKLLNIDLRIVLSDFLNSEELKDFMKLLKKKKEVI